MEINNLQKFKGIPSGWVKTPLSEILPISYGKGLPKAKRDEHGKIPVFGSSGQIGAHSEAITVKPSLIIGRKGSIGAVYHSENPCWPIDTVYFVEEKENIYLKFFLYLLKGLNLEKLDKSTAIPGLSRDDYNSIEVVIAPLKEQKQFSRLDEAVENLQRVKSNLKRYKASVLKAAVEGKLTEQWRAEHPDVEPASQLLERILKERRKKWEEAEMVKMKDKDIEPRDDRWKKRFKKPAAFEASNLPQLPQKWSWARIEDVGNVQLGRQRAPKYHSGPNMRPYLRVQNVFEDKIDLDDVMEMDFPPTDFEKYKLESGDILLNEGQSPELLGRPAIYRGELPNACFTNTLIRFQIYSPMVSALTLMSSLPAITPGTGMNGCPLGLKTILTAAGATTITRPSSVVTRPALICSG